MMKIWTVAVGTVVMVLLHSCQQPSAVQQPIAAADSLQTVDQLKKAVVQENIDFYKKDVAAWGRHFVHSPAVYWICVEDGVTLRATGWQDLQQFVHTWMKENPAPVSDSLLQKEQIADFQAQLADKLAFVRYKKIKTGANGQPQTILEQRTFQWQDSSWKIIGMVSAPGYNSKGSTDNVFVHGEAK
jgi:hypothetical protein